MLLTKRYSQRHITVYSENVQLLPHYLRLFLVLSSVKLSSFLVKERERHSKGNMKGDLQKLTHPAQSLTSHHHRGPGPHPVQQFPFLNLPWWLSGQEPACQCRRYSFDSWVEDPLEKGMATPVFLCRKTHGQSSLVGYSPRGHKRVRYNLATKL